MKARALSKAIAEHHEKYGDVPAQIFLNEEEAKILLRSQTLDQTYSPEDIDNFRRGKLKFLGVPIRPFGRDAGFIRFEMSEETKRNLISLYKETLNAQNQNDIR